MGGIYYYSRRMIHVNQNTNVFGTDSGSDIFGPLVIFPDKTTDISIKMNIINVGCIYPT